MWHSNAYTSGKNKNKDARRLKLVIWNFTRVTESKRLRELNTERRRLRIQFYGTHVHFFAHPRDIRRWRRKERRRIFTLEKIFGRRKEAEWGKVERKTIDGHYRGYKSPSSMFFVEYLCETEQPSESKRFFSPFVNGTVCSSVLLYGKRRRNGEKSEDAAPAPVLARRSSLGSVISRYGQFVHCRYSWCWHSIA